MLKVTHTILMQIAAACLVLPLTVCAQSYPVKPVRIVIAYPPGGVDVTIRLLTNVMDAELGQPIITTQ